MEHMMLLARAIELAVDAKHPCVIYARKPWTPESPSIICYCDEYAESPMAVAEFEYFLECDIVIQLIEDLGDAPAGDKCARIIHYAIYDA